MAEDENKTQEAEEKDSLQGGKEEEASSQETQPEVEGKSEVAQETQISDDQVTSLKDSIAKDISGKVSQEVSRSVLQKIGDALGFTKEEKEELPTDAKKLQSVIDEQVEARFAKMKEEEQKEEKQTEAERQERVNNIVQGWYTQYTQLARSGRVPEIKEAKEGDAGYDARKKIILAIGKMIEQNRAQGIEYTPTISDVLVTNPQVLEGPPGADLPISGNTQVRESGDSFKYSDIHDKSFEEIAQGV